MVTCVVTGGAGFIGSHFVKYLLAHHPDYRVINVDKLTYAGNLENLREVADHPRYRFVQADVADEAAMRSVLAGADYVVHFAAETHVDRSIGDPASFIRTDVFGTYVLLEGFRDVGGRRFLYISTDEVYGEAGEGPSQEESPLMPKSPYAASKAGADRLAYAYWTTYGLPVVITRCTNNYGPNQYPEKMIPLFVTNALAGEPLPVYGDGTNTRDWIHVSDHCRALDLLLHAEGIEGEVYNIGSGEEKSVNEVAQAICDGLDKPRDLIRYVTDREGHVRRHAVSTDKLRSLQGWEPTVAFDDGLDATIKWYVDNPWWWKRIKSGEYLEYYRRQYEGRGVA
ncbi:MAG: dTDP-glucose 4,6-dehydratase [Candidatus Tectimicrobiota bacterium]